MLGAMAPTRRTDPTRRADRAAAGGRPSGLLLAPGSGAGRDQPALVAIDEAVQAGGLAVSRMDFPYRMAGRRSPDRPPVLMEAVRQAALSLAASADVPTGRLLLGGRSMGGRICSMVVAEGFPAAGLVLVSYPLHPPGRPDRLRTDHFPRLGVPCLFLSGTRDVFGSPEELEEATGAIPGPVEHLWLEGGDHGLRGKDAQVAAIVAGWVARR